MYPPPQPDDARRPAIIMDWEKLAIIAYVIIAQAVILIALWIPYVILSQPSESEKHTILALFVTFGIVLFAHGTRWIRPNDLSLSVLHMVQYVISFAAICKCPLPLYDVVH